LNWYTDSKNKKCEKLLTPLHVIFSYVGSHNLFFNVFWGLLIHFSDTLFSSQNLSKNKNTLEIFFYILMQTPFNNNTYNNIMKTFDTKNNKSPIKCGCGENHFYKNRFTHYELARHKEYMVYKRIHKEVDQYEDVEFLD
jgi:hypothetical protein